MATVIHVLWHSGDQSPLILPASIPLDDAGAMTELTRHLDDNWKPIIDTDVDGSSSPRRRRRAILLMCISLPRDLKA